MTDILDRLVSATLFTRFITGVIIFNGLILGLETYPWIADNYGGLIHWLDQLCLAIFTIELVLKLLAWRLNFFRDGWNWFDFIIVSVCLIPGAGSGVQILRTLRILRVLRLVTVVPSLKNVVTGLLRALPGMGAVSALLCLIFYIAAVMATNLYGETFPKWFGSLGESLYSLFQIMTLESWSMGIVRPVMEVHPDAWAFFVPFVVFTSFAVLNLFIGVIVSAMDHIEDTHEASLEQHITETSETEQAILLREIQSLRLEMQQFQQANESGSN